MALPLVQDPNQNLMLMQTKWKAQIDPLFSGPFSNGKALKGIQLNAGSTQIPHGLGSTQQGWFLTDIAGPATVYRSGAFNSTNLVLTSSAAVVVNIWVY